MAPVRRLTAILAADVAGYSRLMGADEEGTHKRLQAHFCELVNPKITRLLFLSHLTVRARIEQYQSEKAEIDEHV